MMVPKFVYSWSSPKQHYLFSSQFLSVTPSRLYNSVELTLGLSYLWMRPKVLHKPASVKEDNTEKQHLITVNLVLNVHDST